MHIELPHEVTQALARLHDAGYAAYIVGGCVRDYLRRCPPQDFDITTDARPEQVLQVFADCRTVQVGIRHGTVLVLMEGMPLEITTYRCDGAYSDGRHPDTVRYASTLREDAQRRDFTMNALGYNDEEGIQDYFGGAQDICRRLIRTVGEPKERFDEDALRILRALRFSAVLDFTIEPATASAIHGEAHRLELVSAERKREELWKLLCGVRARQVLTEYADVLCVVVPALTPAVQDAELYSRSLTVLQALPPDPALRLAVLLQHCGAAGEEEKAAARTLDSLRVDRATRERVLRLVRCRDLPLPCTEAGARRLLWQCGEAGCADLLCLKRAENPGQAEVARAERLVGQVRERGDCYRQDALAVDGRALSASGIPCGPEMGRLLQTLLLEVMDGELPNEREILLARAKTLYESM